MAVIRQSIFHLSLWIQHVDDVSAAAAAAARTPSVLSARHQLRRAIMEINLRRL